MQQTFNVAEWLSTETERKLTNLENEESDNSLVTVEDLINQIEEKQLDLTTTYKKWRDIGFAFSSEFGEHGRPLFHRVSKFHAMYSYDECNKQYSYCLKSAGNGITIGTFFYHAKCCRIKCDKPVLFMNRRYPRLHAFLNFLNFLISLKGLFHMLKLMSKRTFYC